jgi:hypothetical protein
MQVARGRMLNEQNIARAFGGGLRAGLGATAAGCGCNFPLFSGGRRAAAAMLSRCDDRNASC